MAILYIETNFLMSIATGRDPQAQLLLESYPQQMQIAIPSICCMEALSALEDETKQRNRFRQELEQQIIQLGRDLTSNSARALLSNLIESRIENENWLNDIKNRLFEALRLIESKQHISKIELAGNILTKSLEKTLIPRDLTDNLILHCILQHAGQNPNNTKVLLSSNTKDFGKPEVQIELQAAGIIKYFSQSQSFLGWWESQSSS